MQLHNNLGVSYLYDGKVDAAKDEFNKTLELDSLNKNATMYLFECDVFSKATDDDIHYDPDILYKQLVELLKANPNDPVLYLYLGDFYKNHRDIEKALANYQQAIKLNNYVSNAYENIGLIYLNKMEYDKALANLTSAYNSSPWNLQYRDNLASAYYGKQDYQNASVWYYNTLNLDKYHLVSYSGLAHCYRLQNRTKDALITQKNLIFY